MSNLSIYEVLLRYQKKGMSSFHTPGHKNNLFKYWENLDYTELDSTDDLYSPRGCILETEKKASKIFGSGCSLISAGGCTLCIQAMLALFCKKNSKIICSRTIHRSAINTMSILDIKPIFIFSEVDKTTELYAQLTSKKIEFELKKNPDVRAVYITSPDYYGTIADIHSISDVCKKYNVPLLVDNAHGSHLAFLEPNYHPMALGADASADSLHKTLPVFTGGAILHLKNKNFYEKAKSWMEFFGSSSPSFSIMASIDIALNWCKKNGKRAFSILKKEVNRVNESLKFCTITNNKKQISYEQKLLKMLTNKNLKFESFEIILKNFEFSSAFYIFFVNLVYIKNYTIDYLLQYKNISSDKNYNNFFLQPTNTFMQNNQTLLRRYYLRDPVRICLNVSKLGISGEDCANFFRKNKIEAEFYDKKFVVLIPTPFNTKSDFTKLRKTIENLQKKIRHTTYNSAVSQKNILSHSCFFKPKIAYSLHEAIFERESELIETKKAIGRIAAKPENVCPPGVPLVLPGEIIDKNLVEILINNNIKKVNVIKQDTKSNDATASTKNSILKQFK